MKRSGAGAMLVWKTGRAYREAGLSGVLRRGVRSVRNRLLTTNCSLWFQRNLRGATGLRSSPDSGSRIEVELCIDDKSRLVDWLRQHHERFPWIALPEELEHAVGSEHVYAGFVLDGQIVGYVKVGVDLTYVHDFRRVIRIPPGDCFVYDTFVLPAFRHRGVAQQGLAETLAHLERHGLHRIWCHIEEWNAPSLRLFRGAGFEEVARVRFVRTLGFSFFLRDGFAPSRGLDGLFSRSPRRPAIGK